MILQGIACQQKGYILRGKITDPSGTAKLSFELEVSSPMMIFCMDVLLTFVCKRCVGFPT